MKEIMDKLKVRQPCSPDTDLIPANQRAIHNPIDREILHNHSCISYGTDAAISV
jgi:hypothetical protein